MKTVTVIAPTYWESYLINRDATGFDYGNTGDDPTVGDRELAQAQAFEAWVGNGKPVRFVSCEFIGFMAYHDARQFGVLACDCQEYTVLIYD